MTLINNLKQTFDERTIDGNDHEGFDETPRQRRREKEKRRGKGRTGHSTSYVCHTVFIPYEKAATIDVKSVLIIAALAKYSIFYETTRSPFRWSTGDSTSSH